MLFYKMHGIGNDYIYFDCTNNKEVFKNFKNKKYMKDIISKLSDRHFGIGGDGVILILNSKIADIKMVIFNKDGTEAQMCGNGIRCVAKLSYDLKIVKKEEMRIETKCGIKNVKLNIVNDKIQDINVDMGMPIEYRNAKIVVFNKVIDATFVSMGNPHLVIFVKNLNKFPVEKYGKTIENIKMFTNRTNVEFIEIENENNIKMRVWERGAGETLACGTGASASVVAGVINKRLNKNVNVKLLGGTLNIRWDEINNHIYMTGPAKMVFKGEWIDD